jgi:hypothetical protein
MGIGAFFAPSARGQILQEEETEASVAYRGRKRIRQVVDSDEESDASSSSEVGCDQKIDSQHLPDRFLMSLSCDFIACPVPSSVWASQLVVFFPHTQDVVHVLTP